MGWSQKSVTEKKIEKLQICKKISLGLTLCKKENQKGFLKVPQTNINEGRKYHIAWEAIRAILRL